MLKQTKKTKEIYEDIQRKIYYMIPDKWEKMYLYASFIDKEDGKMTGELFFYYIPKGLLKKNPVNVYQIPSKFNIDEKEYLELVEILYQRLKTLRKEYKKIELGETWSNLTISIENINFKIEYRYDDLLNSEYSNYDRHIIWRNKYLGIGMEQLNKEEREILRRYHTGAKTFVREESYESGIYIQNIKNIIDYDTSENTEFEEKTESANKKVEEHEKLRPMKNQILSFLNEEKEDNKENKNLS